MPEQLDILIILLFDLKIRAVQKDVNTDTFDRNKRFRFSRKVIPLERIGKNAFRSVFQR